MHLFTQDVQPPVHSSKRQYSPKSQIVPCPQCGGPKIRKNRICRDCRNKNAHPPEIGGVFIVDGDLCRKLPLTKGMYAIVLEIHYAWLMQFLWFVKGNRRSRTFYACAYDANHKRISLHGMISGLAKTDHKNGDGLDNRPRNLRPCDGSLNGANARLSIANKSGYKGVKPTDNGRQFTTNIVVNRECLYLGLSPDAATAGLKYDAAALYYFGEYARLNFPEKREELLKSLKSPIFERVVLPLNNKSGYRGVSWQKKRKMWVATASLKRKTIIVGNFIDPAEAAVARDIKNLEIHGDKAVLNFPCRIDEYRTKLAAASGTDIV